MSIHLSGSCRGPSDWELSVRALETEEISVTYRYIITAGSHKSEAIAVLARCCIATVEQCLKSTLRVSVFARSKDRT
eukprot:g19970.t1